MATLTVRKLDPVTYEPLQGNGQRNFISDLEAITQIIATRLKLLKGEWFLDLNDGLPLFQSILGSSGGQENLQVILNLISTRITTTPFVTGISELVATYQNRQFVFRATVQTQFGTVVVTNAPGSSSTISGS